MTAARITTLQRPRVLLVGDRDHADFCDALAALRADAELSMAVDPRLPPELIVIAQSRPGTVGSRDVEYLRRAAPLAGVVSLLGSWCEGQARASRPAHETLRLYWHEFAHWWRRQLELRAAGKCPAWARPESLGFQMPPKCVPSTQSQFDRPHSRGVVVLSTARWETADALADVLQIAGYATIWQPPGRFAATVRGAAAGIWEGGQLDACEADELAAFCRRLATGAAPVIALLDFPRVDHCEVAHEAGAAAVLGKPWINADLVAALQAPRKIDEASAKSMHRRSDFRPSTL